MLRANTSRQWTDESRWCLVQDDLPPLRYAVMYRDLTSPRDLFPNGRFSSPTTENQIAAVEREPGVRLPDQLRQIYLDDDGATIIAYHYHMEDACLGVKSR